MSYFSLAATRYICQYLSSQKNIYYSKSTIIITIVTIKIAHLPVIVANTNIANNRKNRITWKGGRGGVDVLMTYLGKLILVLGIIIQIANIKLNM